MTATSPRGGRRLLPPAEWAAGAQIDTFMMRDGLANNLLHSADEGGAQVWISQMAADNTLVAGTPTLYTGALVDGGLGDVPSGSWYLITRRGPFQLSVWDDGTPYQVRVAVYAALETASAATVQVAVSVGTRDTVQEVQDGTGLGCVIFDTFTSTTPIWLTPDVPASDLITVQPLQLDLSQASRTTLDDTGGDPVDVRGYEVFVNVWGKTSLKDKLPVIYGLHVAEYVG